MARRPDENERQMIKNLGSSSVAPSQILSQIKATTGNNLISAQEVYNILAADRKERLSEITDGCFSRRHVRVGLRKSLQIGW